MNWVSKWMNSIHSLARCEVMLGTFLNPNPPWALNQWHGILRLHGQLGEPISLWMVVWFIHGDSPKKTPYMRWWNHHDVIFQPLYRLDPFKHGFEKDVCFKNTTHKIPSKKKQNIISRGWGYLILAHKPNTLRPKTHLPRGELPYTLQKGQPSPLFVWYDHTSKIP